MRAPLSVQAKAGGRRFLGWHGSFGGGQAEIVVQAANHGERELTAMPQDFGDARRAAQCSNAW